MPIGDTTEKFTDPSGIFKVLIGQDDVLNPRGTVYFESDNIDVAGRLEDEWGQPYIVYLDANYDGQVTVGSAGKIVRARVVVQCKGRDRDPLNPKDDYIATVQ